MYIRVPTKITRSNGGWGTQELNNQVGTVTAVTNTATESSIVVSINSSGYSAFQFPTNAVGLAGISPAVVGPSSSGVVPNQQPPGTNLLDSFDNRNVNLIRFGSALFNVAGHASTAKMFGCGKHLATIRIRTQLSHYKTISPLKWGHF